MNVPGVADADPPDEVRDRERPCDRLVDAPDPHARVEQIADGDDEQHRECTGTPMAIQKHGPVRRVEHDVRDACR